MNIIKTYEILTWGSPAVGYIFSSVLLNIEISFYRNDCMYSDHEKIMRDEDIPEWVIYECR